MGAIIIQYSLTFVALLFLIVGYYNLKKKGLKFFYYFTIFFIVMIIYSFFTAPSFTKSIRIYKEFQSLKVNQVDSIVVSLQLNKKRRRINENEKQKILSIFQNLKSRFPGLKRDGTKTYVFAFYSNNKIYKYKAYKIYEGDIAAILMVDGTEVGSYSSDLLYPYMHIDIPNSH